MARRQEIEVVASTKAAPEAVFALLADAATWTAWTPIETVEIERAGDDPPEGVGTIRVLRRGRTVGRDETTELVPGRRFGYRSLSGLPVRDYRGSVDLEPADGGTRIVWRSSFEPKVPGTGTIMRIGIARFLTDCATGLAAYAASRPPA